MFQLKTKIVFGRESIKKLHLKGRKAAIFSSNSMIKYGFTQEVADTIDMPYFIMKDIKSEPEEKDIEKYVEILKREEPDAIIAIGGGSVIDTAKASLYHYKKAKLVAIPSTSGSGSEVTMAAVLAKNGVKYSLVADYIAPIIAILDSRLPEKMPAKLVAYTGMDALAHAIESYVSNIASPFSQAFSIKAIKIIFENLLSSFNGSQKARETMHYASCMAGIAILNARVGICHVMAHKMGIFKIPHGLAISFLLDETMKYNMKDEIAKKRYNKIAKELGLKNAHMLVEEIKRLKEKIGMKSIVSHIDENDFNNKLDLMAKEAAKDALLRFNPRKASMKEIKKIYEKAYYENNQ